MSTVRLRIIFVTEQTDTAAVTARPRAAVDARLAIFVPDFCAQTAAASVWAATLLRAVKKEGMSYKKQ